MLCRTMAINFNFGLVLCNHFAKVVTIDRSAGKRCTVTTRRLALMAFRLIGVIHGGRLDSVLDGTVSAGTVGHWPARHSMARAGTALESRRTVMVAGYCGHGHGGKGWRCNLAWRSAESVAFPKG